MFDMIVKIYNNDTIQLTSFKNPIFEKGDKPPKKEKPEVIDIEDLLPDETPWGDIVSRKLSDREMEQIMEGEKEYSMEELQRRHEHSVRTAFNRTKHKIYDYGRNNKWDWFFTFTLSDNVVKDRTDYKECSAKVRKWLNHLQERRCPDMKYLVIPELHIKRGWHFHALVSGVDNLTFDIAINNGKYRKTDGGDLILDKDGKPIPNKYYGQQLRVSYPDGDFIYNIREYKNGWNTATRIKDTKKAVSYITKYITKDLCTVSFGCRRYYPSRNLTLPEKVKYSGYSVEEIRKDIEESTGLKLVEKCIKTVEIKEGSYANEVTYYEFE